MFSVLERDRVRDRLLAAASEDPLITAAAMTGSYAAGTSDRWSDVDLAFAVAGDVRDALADWTGRLYRSFAAIHHWDLSDRGSVYRRFLLADGLEVDLGFTPAGQFGPLGPTWQLVFGVEFEQPRPPSTDRERELIGLGWHHLLHARTCIERGVPWRAEWLIASAREQVRALGCLRLGLPSRDAKGADQLPAALTEPLRASLVTELTKPELRRALAALTAAFLAELARTDPELTAQLAPALAE